MATAQTARAAAPINSRPASRSVSLTDIVSASQNLPGRYFLYGVEGIGKSSLAAKFRSPIFIMTQGETGLDTLIKEKQLPEIPHFKDAICTWEELLQCVELLTESDHQHKTLAIDTAGGAEKLLFAKVLRDEFHGVKQNDRKEGFYDFDKGQKASQEHWKEFLTRLDRLRSKRQMVVVLISHAEVGAFRNPEGSDYDRYRPDLHKETWAQTHKWADAVLFMNYETEVEKDGLRKKGKGGQARTMYTQRCAAYDAKNRYGLPEQIDLGNSADEAWAAFEGAMRAK